VLDRLLEEARRGDSAVLVIRGEAGVGKTALLRHCARQASGFRGISPRKELHDALPARDRHAAPA
jgi:tRNA A37 threonylcarbamoyladenosine biosynthesis protein TsaE